MTTEAEIQRYASVAEWRSAAAKLFGAYIGGWRFRCPSCGHVATPDDFKALGADPGRAPFGCIGRVLRERGRADETYTGPRWVVDGYDDEADEERGHWDGPQRKDSDKPCDWAAGGLLGTLSEGVIVADGKGGEIHAFSFAEVE